MGEFPVEFLVLRVTYKLLEYQGQVSDAEVFCEPNLGSSMLLLYR